MKKLLQLSFLTLGIAFSTSMMGQEQIKKDAATTADKLETPKPADTKADKQEPAKSAPAPGASKSESKTDSSSGTRMAITEQGVPKRSKNKGKKVESGTNPTPTPTKAEEPPKK